ncbi:MAG: hypothetical protein ACOYWZ_11390 [Bacillota bacterium]
MKTVMIPKFFHELFGEKQNIIELLLIIAFTIVSAITVGMITLKEWQQYAWYQLIVLVLLYLDIAGGVIANLTFSTNRHYQDRPKARLVFIAIHVQPLIIGFVLQTGLWICVVVWAYTIVSALIVNALNELSIQRSVGGLLMTIGLMGLFLLGQGTQLLILIILLLFIIKVIFSFAVNHFSQRGVL